MPTYTFTVNVTVIAVTDVEASTLEDAILIAKRRGVAPLCEYCESQYDTKWVVHDVESMIPTKGALVGMSLNGGAPERVTETKLTWNKKV